MNIPHVFPEGAPPAYIDNPDELRRKTDLIQSLEQLQDAASMVTTQKRSSYRKTLIISLPFPLLLRHRFGFG